METNKHVFRISGMMICVLLAGCGTTNAPRDWLPEAPKVPLEPYGAWVEVETQSGQIEGELIAVSPDSLFVADTSLHVIGRPDIRSARLAYFDSYNLWTAPILGPILTISNGVYLIFTAPMWIFGGSIAAAASSYDPIIDYPKNSLSDFTRYARFPAGIPQNVDPAVIVRKQVPAKKSAR